MNFGLLIKVVDKCYLKQAINLFDWSDNYKIFELINILKYLWFENIQTMNARMGYFMIYLASHQIKCQTFVFLWYVNNRKNALIKFWLTLFCLSFY